MNQRYHFTNSGAIAPCNAKVRPCPRFSFEKPEPSEFEASEQEARRYRLRHADRVRTFRFRQPVIEAFTAGDCWRLAVAVHKISGWPLHAIAFTKQDGRSQDERSYAHIFAVNPEGFAVDVEGVHQLGEAYLLRYKMLDGWREDLGQENHYQALDATAYVKQVEESWVEFPEFSAEHYARLVLKQHASARGI